jgi:hypothetical protein
MKLINSPILIGTTASAVLAGLAIAVGITGCGGSSSSSSSGLPGSKANLAQVEQGRQIVTSFGCVDCHSHGKNDPTDPAWMDGHITGEANGIFAIGPFNTYCPNLTPDVATGIGGFTDRQIFNALRYGLDPSNTPDEVITPTNFPTTPFYLAPPMPWTSTRHLSDSDTWAVVAYLKHGIKAVTNTVPDSTGPPDHWASSYTTAAVGPASFPGYPEGNEQFTP